jgi:energy-coupling factor transporter ATP-binding protein EcfA2
VILRGLTYRHPGPGGFVLGPVNLEGPDDRLWLVLGATGAGKTTLLRLLGGAIRPDAGSVEGAGSDAAYLPQLPERALAGRNLAEDLCGEVRPGWVLRAELRRILGLVGLAGVPLSRRSRGLSAGERRRLALGLLLQSGRADWALDEPEAGLDAEGERRLLEVVGERVRSGAGRLWIATHRFEAYAPLDPWALVLARGGTVATGPLRAVLRQPDVEALLSLGERPSQKLWISLRTRLRGVERGLGDPPPEGGRIAQLHALLSDRAGVA